MQPMKPHPLLFLNWRRFDESQQQYPHFDESPEQYERITLPYICEQLKAGNTEWTDNIVEGKQEAERVVYRDWHPDNGFFLLPKISWEKHGFPANKLYFHAFVLARGIRTIRDLRGQHLPLLKNLYVKITSYLMYKYNYGIASGHHYKMFFHYHPKTYHLHLHVTLNSLATDKRNVYLEQVIANISKDPSYYAKANLTIHLDPKKNAVLCRKFMPKQKKDENWRKQKKDENWRSKARK